MAGRLTEDAFKRIVRAVLEQERRLRNPEGSGGGSDGLNQIWWPWKNTGSTTIRSRGVIELAASVPISAGNLVLGILSGKQPTTTFTGRYAVNSSRPVAAGETGMCVTTGLAIMSYDSGTPADGDGYGPKPNSDRSSKGYPGFTSHGVWNASEQLMLASIACPIRTLLGKSSSDIAAASGTSTVTPGSGTVTVWADTGSGYVATSLTFTGYNVAPTAVTAGQLTLFVESQGRFVAGEGGETIYPRYAWAQLNGALTSGTDPATIDSISMHDGGSAPSVTSADNRMGLAGNDNDKCLVMFITSSAAVLVNVQHHAC